MLVSMEEDLSVLDPACSCNRHHGHLRGRHILAVTSPKCPGGRLGAGGACAQQSRGVGGKGVSASLSGQAAAAGGRLPTSAAAAAGLPKA